MKRFLAVIFFVCLLISVAVAQSGAAEESGKKPLTIEAIFAPGGITGREPESVQWSPDNTKLSFIQRDDSGEHGELWSVDAMTGQKTVLVNEVEASLACSIHR